MPSYGSLWGWIPTALSALGLAVAAGSADAAVFTSSASFGGYVPPLTPFDVMLPQYSGPAPIAAVTLTIKGVASGVDYFEYDPTVGITIASYPVSWQVQLLGPASGGSYPLAVAGTVSTTFVGGTIPPCDPNDPSCGGFAEANFGPTASTPFSASVNLLDLSDFQGTGANDFLVLDASAFDNNGAFGTVTETITLAIPEPSTWIVMLAGFGAVGATLRRRRLGPA